jgi:hypothetical protein
MLTFKRKVSYFPKRSRKQGVGTLITSPIAEHIVSPRRLNFNERLCGFSNVR